MKTATLKIKNTRLTYLYSLQNQCVSMVFYSCCAEQLQITSGNIIECCLVHFTLMFLMLVEKTYGT